MLIVLPQLVNLSSLEGFYDPVKCNKADNMLIMVIVYNIFLMYFSS